MVMGSKEQQHLTCHGWPFLFLCLVPHNLNPPAKFAVCSFNISSNNRGPKLKKLVTLPIPRPFLIVCFVYLTLNPAAKFDVCTVILARDNRGSQKGKRRSRDLGHAPFWSNFLFFSISYRRSGCKI